jgi:polyhydroxyalkanoate synthesis regulator phasin
MAKKKEVTQLTPREMIRKGWLAYLGVYGAAYERANEILTGKGADMFEDFVAKGEKVETQAQDAIADMRERAQDVYGDRLDGFRKIFPSARKGRVEELEAEIEALNKKVAALSKKTTKRSAKKAA